MGRAGLGINFSKIVINCINPPLQILHLKKQLVYPDSDGQAMADNTKQFQEIEKNKRDAKLRELGIDPDTL